MSTTRGFLRHDDAPLPPSLELHEDSASVDLEMTSLSPREQQLGERFRHAATLVARGETLGVRTRTTVLAVACFLAGAAVSALALRGGEAEEDDGWEAPAAEDASVAGREEAERDEGVFRWTLVLGILAVSATIAVGEQCERAHWYRVPEAAVGVLLGVGCAGFASAVVKDEQMVRDEAFDAEFFMVWLLPPIIFGAGFNLNIGAFFASIVPTLLLAFVGTSLSAAVVGGIVFVAGQLGLCYALSSLASLFFGALISATDPVTVLAVFKAIGVRDDIFSIVFGESVLNDAVAIVLARTVLAFTEPEGGHGSGGASALFSALLIFVAIFLGSMFIGGVAGLLSALGFKALRLNDHDDKQVVEASLSFAFPWVAFYASEALGLSGIVAILFCGMVMATYTRPNLSAAAVRLTSELYDALAKVSEAFVFVYLGMALVAFPIFSTHNTLWLLALVALAACLLGRLHVFPLLFLATRRQHRATATTDTAASASSTLGASHAFCIWFSGLRGGVAFALAAASYGAKDFPAVCGGFATEIAANKQHCPKEVDDSLALVQVTLLIAVFTIFVFGALSRDVAVACGALRPQQPPTASGASAASSLGATHDQQPQLSASSRWKRIDARLVLLLTRAPKARRELALSPQQRDEAVDL